MPAINVVKGQMENLSPGEGGLFLCYLTGERGEIFLRIILPPRAI